MANCMLYKIHTFRGDLEILGGCKRWESWENLLLWTQNLRGGSCYPQGNHAFGKYLILFMIIYMMVKLGLVLWFLRMDKVLHCYANFVIRLSSYIIFFLLRIQLSVEGFNSSLLIWIIRCFAGTVTLTICMLVLHQ